MRQADRHAGFTLIEVSLAIVIGLILIAGAVVIFQQSRNSAQNAAAKEKLMSLSMLVEELEQRNFALPSRVQLASFWKQRRPDDYDKSPWGGTFTITGDDWVDGNDVVGDGQEIGSGLGGTPFGGTTIADRGRLYYFRREPNTGGRRFIWMDEFNVFGPEDPQSIVRLQEFGVGLLGPDGRQWYYVEGRNKTNQAGGPLTAEGQITN